MAELAPVAEFEDEDELGPLASPSALARKLVADPPPDEAHDDQDFDSVDAPDLDAFEGEDEDEPDPVPVRSGRAMADVPEPAEAPRKAPTVLARAPAPVPARALPRPAANLLSGRRDPQAYELPPLPLLTEPKKQIATVSKDALEQNATLLESTLEDFGVRGEIINVRPGPVVTLYELEPAPGTKSSRVISLADDIARSMSAVSARVAVVPGRNAIGIELPNAETRDGVPA